MESTYVYRNSDGVKRTMVVEDTNPDAFKVYTEVQMDEVLDNIKRTRDLPQTKSANRLVARVPMTVVELSIHEQWDEGDWKKWLNDPDNAAFRIWQGQV